MFFKLALFRLALYSRIIAVSNVIISKSLIKFVVYSRKIEICFKYGILVDFNSKIELNATHIWHHFIQPHNPRIQLIFFLAM